MCVITPPSRFFDSFGNVNKMTVLCKGRSGSPPPPFHIVVQPPTYVRLCVTPRTAAHQASLPFPVSWSLLSLMSVSRWCRPTISSSVVLFSSCPLFHEAGQSSVCTDMFDQNVDSFKGWEGNDSKKILYDFTTLNLFPKFKYSMPIWKETLENKSKVFCVQITNKVRVAN